MVLSHQESQDKEDIGPLLSKAQTGSNDHHADHLPPIAKIPDSDDASKSLPTGAGASATHEKRPSSGVLERAKAGAAKIEAEKSKHHHNSVSSHKDISPARKRESDDLQSRDNREDTTPLYTQPNSPEHRSSVVSPPPIKKDKAVDNSSHHSVATADTEDESDSDEEDFFSRISTAVSKASGAMSGVSMGPNSSKHHGMNTTSDGKKKKKGKMNPRTRLIVIFLGLELAILGLGLWVAKTLENSIFTVEVSSTGATLEAVQALYFAKVGRLDTGYGQMAVESLFQSYAETKDPTLLAEVNFRLVAETQSREIEFSTLLDADMKIIASSNKPRDGELFDPDGVVSALQSSIALGFNQVSISAVLSNAELQAELPPQWLERADASSPALFGLHPYDTGRNALIRYVVVAVPSISDPTKIVGYLLAGDIVNGKMSIPGNVYIALWGSSSRLVTDGYVGVYMSDDMTRSGWNVCNHAAMATIQGLDARAMSLDVDVAPRDLLDRALAANGEKQVSATKTDAFVFVAKKAPNLSANIPGDQGDPPVVLVQATHSLNWALAFRRSMTLLGIVFAIDVFAIYMASCIFLGPLERLGNRIRKGKSLSMHTVEKLKHRRHLIAPILCIPLASFAFSIYCMKWASLYIDNARMSAAVKKTSNVGVSYGSKIDAIRLGFTRLSKDSNIMAVAAGGLNVTDAILADVKSQLAYQRDNRLMQYSILVDADRKILYDPNGDEFTGQVFDPRGLVTSALSKGNLMVSSIVLTYAEFSREKAPARAVSLEATSPPSALYPYDAPQNDVLVRFIVTPIITTDSVGGHQTVGALIAGDVANGINLIPETANQLLDQEGYSAIYIVPNLDEEAGDQLRFELISSAMRQNHTSYEVDLELDGVQAMLLQVYNTPTDIALEKLMHDGHTHLTTARCAPSDYTFKPEGRLFLKRKTGAKCDIIVVQSARGTATNYLALRVVKTSVILLLAQVAKLLVLLYLLYKAFLPFKRIILGKRGGTMQEGMRGRLHKVMKFFGRRQSNVRVDPTDAVLMHGKHNADPNATPTKDNNTGDKKGDAYKVPPTPPSAVEKKVVASNLKGSSYQPANDKSHRQRPSNISFHD